MNAITEPPSVAPSVAASWASAIRSPRLDSELRVTLREIGPVIEPTTRLASGAESDFHLSIVASCSASGVTSRVTAWFTLTTDERTTSRVFLSSNSSVSVITRPNEAALVTLRGAPDGSGITQEYGWWVCPVTTRSIAGSRFLAISTIGPESAADDPELHA